MIPRTWPSTLVGSTRAMHVNVLGSVAGLRRWIDFIPIKITGDPGANLNSYNGSAYAQAHPSPGTAIAWVDFIPVAVVSDPNNKAWTSDNDGFIPVFGISVGPVPSADFSNPNNSQLLLVSIGGL